MNESNLKHRVHLNECRTVGIRSYCLKDARQTTCADHIVTFLLDLMTIIRDCQALSWVWGVTL